MKRRTKTKLKKKKELDGNTEVMISTGSTLLDLAIAGTRIRGGGLPGGILVEVYGPSGLGKTVLLSEIAGDIQRQGGDVLFQDPESRLNAAFASIFDFELDPSRYETPNTVPEVFKRIREWEPEPKKDGAINGAMTDSLAALSTNLEMTADDGDKMGMRRAKEFSEETRKTCRIITEKNLLLVCSNQVRVNANAGPFSEKYTTPGGEAIPFYASIRLRMSKAAKDSKIKREVKAGSKTVKRVIGVTSSVEVSKSSVDKPFRTAPLTIIFDYGIDDVRQNLKFIKEHTSNTTYMVGETKLNTSLEKSITMVEEQDLETLLKNEVIDLWEEIESRFETPRKTKKR